MLHGRWSSYSDEEKKEIWQKADENEQYTISRFMSVTDKDDLIGSSKQPSDHADIALANLSEEQSTFKHWHEIKTSWDEDDLLDSNKHPSNQADIALSSLSKEQSTFKQWHEIKTSCDEESIDQYWCSLDGFDTFEDHKLAYLKFLWVRLNVDVKLEIWATLDLSEQQHFSKLRPQRNWLQLTISIR